MTTTLPIPVKAGLFTPPSAPHRQLAYNFFGADSTNSNTSAPTLFYFHGYPASHLEAALFHPFALEQNVRILAITRPGYGESTYVPERNLLDWPNDVLALADHLGIERFGVVGVSGGGPYVFACLHEIPQERLLAAGVVAGLYPPGLGFAGMGLKQRSLLNAAVWAPGLLTWVMRGQFEKIRAKDAVEGGNAVEEFLDAEMKGLPAVDCAVWQTNEAGFRDAMVASCRMMVRGECAVDAIAQEARLFGSPWGFEIGELDVDGRLVLWHGGKDFNVPCRMAREAKEVLGERVELRVREGEGHGSLVVRVAGEVVETVVLLMYLFVKNPTVLAPY